MSSVMSNFTKSNPTIEQELRSLLGDNWSCAQTQLAWPPDIFAICAWLLEASGGYLRVISEWPPKGDLPTWTIGIKNTAGFLRKNATDCLSGDPVIIPNEVNTLWEIIITNKDTPLETLSSHPEVCDALLELIAMADEACVGFGLPLLSPAGKAGKYEEDLILNIQANLQDWDTLTPHLPATRLRILPKQHTPRFGITMRSLTHHLSMFTGGEVAPTWSIQPEPRGPRLNLLVIPWPFKVQPSQFSEATCPKVELAEPFKCFDYKVYRSADLLEPGQLFKHWLENVFNQAKLMCGDIHGVIFPEASLTSEDFEILEKVAFEAKAFVVAGVAHTTNDSGLQENFNEVWMTFGEDKGRADRKISQGKHHRWQLDKSQIEMYGLGGSLDPNHKWWENTAIKSRGVNFVAVHGHLTICCLICEDLARQDPVARMVRAVGPNLVIALLSDGPQIAPRWPARYATVLADDPGSSVLTVTSLGMTQLADPPPGKAKSRAIALWKDALGGLKEISLEQGASAVVLNLWTSIGTEFTADGRSDGGAAAYPALAGCHQVFVK